MDSPWTLGWLALACASISFTLTKTPVFDWLRDWLRKRVRGKFTLLLFELWECPYCMSHWVAFALLAALWPYEFTSSLYVNFVICSFVVITLATFIFQAIILMKDLMDYLRASVVAMKAQAQRDLSEIGRH